LRSRRAVAAFHSLATALCITLLIGILPLDNFAINTLGCAYPPNPVVIKPMGILILGGAENIAPDYTGAMAA